MKLVLKTATAALMALASLSAAPQAGQNLSWKPVTMDSNLPPNPIAMAVSPENETFLAIASDNTGTNDYSVFHLDEMTGVTGRLKGWFKVASLSLPGTADDLIFGDHHFYVTGHSTKEKFVAVSSDALNWNIATPKSSTPFVGIGSDGSDHTAYLFDTFDGQSENFVTIGDSHFSPGASHRNIYFLSHPDLVNRFVSIVNPYGAFTAIASDGTTYEAY